MLYKRDFYNFRKSSYRERGIPPPTPSPRSVASLPRRGPQTKCAPFEVFSPPNLKVFRRAWTNCFCKFFILCQIPFSNKLRVLCHVMNWKNSTNNFTDWLLDHAPNITWNPLGGKKNQGLFVNYRAQEKYITCNHVYSVLYHFANCRL